MNKPFLEHIKSYGLTYSQYHELLKHDAAASNSFSMSDDQKSLYEKRKLNLHRMTRIDKHCHIEAEMKNLINHIQAPQLWMIISETWCGDSAQNIPYIAKIAELNPRIDLRIIMRDENPSIMDLYLTNGTRSIPILVAFDEIGNKLFRWGPRPKEAQELFNELKEQGIEKKERMEKLHLWYGKNRGKNLQSELTEAIRNLSLNAT